MKIQSIFIFLVLIELFVAQEGKLSAEENKERLDKCGRPFNFARPSKSVKAEQVDDGKWPKWLKKSGSDPNKDPQNNGDSPSTYISKRHYLTSSQVIMREDFWFRAFGKVYDVGCPGNSSHIELPKKFVKTINFYQDRCKGMNYPQNCQNDRVKARRAWLLHCCDGYTKKYFPRFQTPMLVEIEENYAKNWLCVAEVEVKRLKVGEEVEVYSYAKDQTMKHRHVKVQYMSWNDMGLEYWNEPGDRGGPVIRSIGTRWTLNGLTASVIPLSFKELGVDVTVAHNLEWLAQPLCDLAGICKEEKVNTDLETTTTTTTITTTPEPTTLAPTTSVTTTTSETPTESTNATETSETLESPTTSSESLTTSSTTPKLKTTTPETPITQTENFQESVDAEYEAWEAEKQKLEAPEDKDINNDFFVDADFRNGGFEKKKELVWELSVVIFMILV